IGVAAASQPDARVAGLAEAVGRQLAEAGGALVCGRRRGGAGGRVRRGPAAPRGPGGAAGTPLGLMPGDRPDEGNPYLSVTLPTGLGQGRNLLLVRASDALVAVGGGDGTLSEIAIAL